MKAIAIYRDGCKVAQPLSTKGQTELISAKPQRRVMPIDRQEIGRKFKVGEYEGYIHVGMFPEGDPGDIFVDIAKEGTTLAGLMNAFMIAVSVGIQYGVPLDVFVSKFAHMRFEPSGLTNDPDIRDRQVDPRLHLPLDGQALPGRRRAGRPGHHEPGRPRPDGRRRRYAPTPREATRPRRPRRPARRPCSTPGTTRVECAKCGGRKVQHRRLLHVPRLRRQLGLRLIDAPGRPLLIAAGP